MEVEAAELPEVEARHKRGLEAVAWKPLFGA
jgi:hypothetical protein